MSEATAPEKGRGVQERGELPAEAPPRAHSKMQETTQLGVDFWNDSCDPRELAEAVAQGAVGATSNPVIVNTAARSDPQRWTPALDRLIAEHPEDTEDDIAWRLVAAIGQEAAAQLRPVYEATGGRKGFLSMQVNPKLFPSARRMLEHARTLAQVASNVCIKVPATRPGLAAGEELVAEGMNVNVTVSFTISQAVAAAEMIERGLDRARAAGRDMVRLHPYVTLMLGRLDDHLGRVLAKQSVSIDPGYVHWAGVAVFKKTRQIFRQRGFRGTLLAAAYRHHLHWSQLVGPGIVQSMPYAWWKQFNASDIEVRPTLDEPVEPRIIDELARKFPEFVKAHEEGALSPEEFVHYGASVHTLNQFIGGYQDLLALVRERMLR